MILILTHKIDLCADLVLQRLQALGRQALRVNLEDFPLEITATYAFNASTSLILDVYGKRFDLSEVRSVWYRVPFEYSARRWASDYQLTRFI